MKRVVLFALLLASYALSAAGQSSKPARNPVGGFKGGMDVGTGLLPGSAKYDKSQHKYTVTGGGENIWISPDAFYFVWRPLDSDVAISSDIAFDGNDGQIYAKAGFMIRSGFAADAPYVDAVIHSGGLTALQYRTETGKPTEEVHAAEKAPKALRLERHGNVYSISLAGDDGKFQPAGSVTVDLKGPLYIGLVVCAHDPKTTQTATFTNLELKASKPAGQGN